MTTSCNNGWPSTIVKHPLPPPSYYKSRIECSNLLLWNWKSDDNLDFLTSNCSNALDIINNKFKKHSVSKNDLTLFEWIVVRKFSAFCLEFPKFFLITRTIFSHRRSEKFCQQNTISNFPCMFLHPNYFFQLISLIWKTSRNSFLKNILFTILVLTFHWSNKLFKWSQNFLKFSAFSLEFQKFFLITGTIFSHSRSEQFW